MEGFIILALILLNGFFVLAEFSLVTAKKTKIIEKVHNNDQRAAKVLKLLEKPERFLSAIQIVITLIGLITGAYSGLTMADDLTPFFAQFPLLASHAHNISFIVIITVVTYLSLLLGELLPKTIGMNNPEKVAMFVAPFIEFFTWITRPLEGFLSLSLKIIQKIFHLPTHN
jgi:putative hemolysin